MSKPRWAAGAALVLALASRAAFAQDPPPPMIPGDVPAPTPEPPPAPSPDVPPPAPAPGPAPYAAPPPPANFSPQTAPVEPPPAPEPPSRDRRKGTASRAIKGYVFPTPLLIDSAFVTSHVGLGAEVGHYWAFGKDPQFTMSNSLNMNGTDVPYDLSMGYTTESVSIGIAPWERAGFTLDASHTSYIASDINGAVFNGSQYAWDVRPGMRFRLLHSPGTGTQIALHLYADFTSSSQVNPTNAFLTLASQINGCIMTSTMGCPLKLPATTHTITTASGGATLSLAEAFTSTFGVQAALGTEVGYGWINSYGSQLGATPVAVHVGLAPSIDLGPSVPLAIMAEYLFTFNYLPTNGLVPAMGMQETTPDAGTVSTLSHQFAFGVYYTGRSDLSVGALFTATVASSQLSFTDSSSGTAVTDTADLPPVRALGGQLNARYFF